MENTFAMIKPDGVRRGFVGEIIGRLEKKGIRIVALKTMVISRELAAAHYAEHLGKPFFEGLLDFITSGPVVAMMLEGENVIEVVRTLMGVTDPLKASPGTIRGDLAMTIDHNIMHGSDSAASAAREIRLFFPGLQFNPSQCEDGQLQCGHTR